MTKPPKKTKRSRATPVNAKRRLAVEAEVFQEFVGRSRRAQRAIDETMAALDTGVCRVCGCTNDDCRQCIAKTGEPCYWVEADLCSACAAEMKADEVAALALLPPPSRSSMTVLIAKLRERGVRVTLSIEPPSSAKAAWERMGLEQ